MTLRYCVSTTCTFRCLAKWIHCFLKILVRLRIKFSFNDWIVSLVCLGCDSGVADRRELWWSMFRLTTFA